MCSTSQFLYRWLKGCIYSSCHYHDQIGSIRLFHCYHIFPWLCAWDVYYIIFCHLLYIHSFNLIIIIVQTYLHWTPDVLWCLALSGHHLSSCTVLYLTILLNMKFLMYGLLFLQFSTSLWYFTHWLSFCIKRIGHVIVELFYIFTY